MIRLEKMRAVAQSTIVFYVYILCFMFMFCVYFYVVLRL